MVTGVPRGSQPRSHARTIGLCLAPRVDVQPVRIYSKDAYSSDDDDLPWKCGLIFLGSLLSLVLLLLSESPTWSMRGPPPPYEAIEGDMAIYHDDVTDVCTIQVIVHR